MIPGKRKKRNKMDPAISSEDALKLTEDELDVAKYLYKKMTVKDGLLSGTTVQTFNPSEAVELLLDSPWAKVELSEKKASKNRKPHLFTNLDDVVEYLNILIQKRMIYRVSRVRRKQSATSISGKSKDDGKSCKSKSAEAKGLTDKESLSRKTESMEPKKAAVDPSTKSASEEPAPPSTSTKKSSNTKPMRLEVHPEQVFVLDDPLTAYVWLYEAPPGLFIWLAGSALLIGIILCCLFPIWPVHLRTGAYYLTLCASGLFGLLLIVALIRFVLYLFVWLVTLGSYAFWLFPNFFEDCGFFESFRPVYSIKKVGEKRSVEKTKKSSIRTPKPVAAKLKSTAQSTNCSKTVASEQSCYDSAQKSAANGFSDATAKVDAGKID